MDFSHVHPLFPIKQKMVYLNNASIGASSTRVVAAVNGFMEQVRDSGRINYPQWCQTADTTFKRRIAKLINANSDEIAYVKNTTEGILIVANGLEWQPGDNVVIAEKEYASNVYPWMNLARRGVNIRWVKTSGGRVTPAAIEAQIDARTRLVSVSAVQFWNGYRVDLAKVSEICRRRRVLLNVDAIQWLGSLHMDVARYNIDFMSAGAHKWLLGPIGTGFFYCRRESLAHIWPQNVGYHSVDKSEAHLDYDLTFRDNAGRFEEALVNFPGIFGLDVAVQQLLELGTVAIEQHVLGLTEQARIGLLTKGYEIVSPDAPGERSGVLAFRHPLHTAEYLEQQLGAAGIHVAVRAGNLRISPTFYNDNSEIDRFLAALPA